MKKLLVFIALLLSAQVKAGLITHNGYTLNEDTDIVTGGGLEWLQWDVTLNRSQGEFKDGDIDLSAYGTGWRIASVQEVSTLFETFFPNVGPWPTHESQTFQLNTSQLQAEAISIQALLSLFGISDINEPWIFASYGEDKNNNELYPFLSVTPINHHDYLSGMHTEEDLLYTAYTDQGLALVRTAGNTTVTAVPEPSTVMLFTLVIAGLIVSRRFS